MDNDRNPIALAVALQPQAPGRPWHAAVVTAQGQAHEFDSLAALVQFLVRLSLVDTPPAGLK